jgi:hypothetical protein
MSVNRRPHALVHPFRITLVAFLEDLKKLEQPGLEQDQCNAVLRCLDAILHHLTSGRGSSQWLADLIVPFSSLRDDYHRWNSPVGDVFPPSHRATLWRELRKHKDGLLPRYRFGPLFATAEEINAFQSVYSEFIKLESVRPVPSRIDSPFRKTVQRAMQKKRDIA